MIDTKLSVDRASAKRTLTLTDVKLRGAILKALDRMGLFVEADATTRAAVNTGRMKGAIHKTDADYDSARKLYSIDVVADVPYARYVEHGFRGHFVPFHIAPDLYQQARIKWGWKVPAPGSVSNPKPGVKYLVPPYKGSPQWGVFVKGDAQPFMNPALKHLLESGAYDMILRAEIARARLG